MGENLACCVFHNFYEMRRLPLPPSTSSHGNKDILVGFDNPILHLVDGRAAKDTRIAIRDVLIEE